jgi:hypothetical protein
LLSGARNVTVAFASAATATTDLGAVAVPMGAAGVTEALTVERNPAPTRFVP